MALNVIIVASEAAPFAKTGGLGDVAGALPVALKELGCKVFLFLPCYRQVLEGSFGLEPTGLEVTVALGSREIKAQVLRGSTHGIPVYFIRRDEFYDRAFLYGTPEGDYFDNLERYAFFSRAVIEALKARGFEPDIIHCNDWQTGLIPAYLKDTYKNNLYFTRTSTVFTIHNIAYQGVFKAGLFPLTGLSPAVFGMDGLEFWGNVNLLKSGLVYSDVINTVSPAYSKEIQTPEFGCGMEGVLNQRKDRLFGILNGVDYNEWGPDKDVFIPQRYSINDLSGKLVAKRALLREFGLNTAPAAPVIGIISRLAEQKGFDILAEAMPELMGLDAGMVILGTGDRKYQDLLEGLAARYPGRLSVRIAFNNKLAHLVEAGADMLLMPSKYEPCGLNQIYSLRYGTVPVVRATGGLEDTVRDHATGSGNGFKFKEYTAAALVEKVREAVSAYKDRGAWQALQKTGMREDLSWSKSAARYMDLYKLALRLKENEPGKVIKT